MRAWIAMGTLGVGCSFGGAGGGDAESSDAPGAADSVPIVDGAATDDAFASDAAATWCAGTIRRWDADFSVDPTTVDGDGDQVLDWVVRGDGTFPVTELAAGVWKATPGPVLDTRPFHDFLGMTRVAARMRAASTGGIGATVWIQADHGAGMLAPLWVTLQLGSGEQLFALHNKSPGDNDIELVTRSGLPLGFVDITLEIDPATSTVTTTVDGLDLGSATFTRIQANADRFSAVLPYGTESEFDRVVIETCE